jgi:NAD(P)-dependent dehydrogenase (short-subunit alcohol dehydrogenase family)
MMANFLHGKTAAITGGSGTIGLAMARALLSPSGITATSSAPQVGVDSLILVGRSLEKLQKAQASLQRTVGASSQQTVSIFSCDVSDENSVVQLFQSFDQQFPGGIDLWINNAGMHIQVTFSAFRW